MTLGFIMTRHVNSEQTNRYWKESYRSIRRFYPTHLIMIIDDDSRPEHVRHEDLLLENCFLVRSEFPRCGELLAYYYFHKYRLFDRAIFLHDSVFVQKYLDFDETKEYQFIWHFVEHQWDEEKIEVGLLSRLRHGEELIEFYHQKEKWYGCFGLQAVCTLKWVDRMEETYGFLALVDHIKDRPTRSCMERVIGCIATYDDPTIFPYPSIFGSIFAYIHWNYQYDTYLLEKETADHILRMPLIKVWSAR